MSAILLWYYCYSSEGGWHIVITLSVRIDHELSMTSSKGCEIFRFFFLNISDGYHFVVTLLLQNGSADGSLPDTNQIKKKIDMQHVIHFELQLNTP